MRGVGTGYEEGLVALGTRLVFHLVGLGLVIQTFFQHILHIGDGASLASLGKLQRDKGVKAHATGAEEGQVVDDAIVEGLYLAAVDDMYGFLDIHRQAQMARQTVA